MNNVTALTEATQSEPVSKAGVDMTPRTLDDAFRFADILSTSSIVPKDYQGNPGNILVAIQWGAEIGLPPLQAMQNIAVINGRPAIWGDAMIALVRGSGALTSIVEDIADDGQSATCTVTRRNEDPVSRTFTMEDAKIAGLLGKLGPWKQYPRRMLQMRARAWVLRDVFPDVLKGVYVAEEAQDMPPDEQIITANVKPAKDRAQRAQAALAHKQDGIVPPAINQVLEAISVADTDEALAAAADLAAQLKDRRDKTTARTAWKARKQAIESAAEPRVDTSFMDAAESMQELNGEWQKGSAFDGARRAAWDEAYQRNRARLESDNG
jgi:hypothetical protein